MAVFAIAFFLGIMVWLLLTAGSGNIGFWAMDEIAFGIVFSLVAALLAKNIFFAIGIRPSAKTLSPKTWALLVVYLLGPFFLAMAKANLDVAYRVITGKIRPGIVRLHPNLKSDLGLAMLANSITLTPGTLSVEINEARNLYVHWIFVQSKDPKPEQVYGSFEKWIRRILE